MIDYTLFWIIRRICKDPRINASLDAVKALHYNPIFVGVDKFIVQDDAPNSMHQFASAVRQDLSALGLPLAVKS